MPEFIIRFNDAPDLVVIVECKASVGKHRSKQLGEPEKYAVDGVLHYASFLANRFDVLAIAVSGTTETAMKVSHYLHLRGQDEPGEIFGEHLLPPADYVKGYLGDPRKERQDFESLQKFIRDLNDKLHICKVSESERSILISAVLIALERASFKKGYRSESDPQMLAKSVVSSAVAQLRDAGVRGNRLKVLEQQFSFLSTTPVLSKSKHKLRDIIEETDREVNSFIATHKYVDVLGSLYVEFLRYANSDKGLGIVLTPPHITKLFPDLAQVNPKSVVYDNCAGTGGFLISAMRKMIADSNGSVSEEKAIKKKRIYGIEIQSNIYPLAVSNMYIHQDGKSNIELGSCFDPKMIEKFRALKPTVGFLNPPYKADKRNDREELEFVQNNLDCLSQGGTCVAILPMQSALSTHGRIARLKGEIMAKHTLEAVCSMPDELFFNSDVNVVSCIMVFSAHRRHPAGKETFLGYFKNDGFEKTRIGGRCDANNRWEATRAKWLDLYFKRRSEPGLSVCVAVNETDEWVPEAYMETDYSVLNDELFSQTMHDYSTYLFSGGICSAVSDARLSPKPALPVRKREWRTFQLEQIFAITGTRTTPLRELQLRSPQAAAEHFPYVTTASTNNGVGGKYPHFTEEGRVLTVDSAVTGFCSYQHWNFSASDHVEKLIPKFRISPLAAMFLVTIINMEQYRYNYGRKCSQTRLKKSKVCLPAKKDGTPDFAFMEKFVARLPFSANMRAI